MKRSLFLVFLAICATLSLHAASNFTAKSPYHESIMGRTSQTSVNVYIHNMFNFPDGVDEKSDLSKLEGLTFEVKSDNATLFNTSGATLSQEYSTKYSRLSIKQMPNQYGTAVITVSLTYNGETVSNTTTYDVLRAQPSTSVTVQSYSVVPKQMTKEYQLFDVMPALSWANSTFKNTATLTIDNLTDLKCGQYETGIFDGGKYPVIKFSPKADLKNFSRDVVEFTITLATGEKFSAKANVNVHENLYASKILEYVPAPGQFRNANGWDDPQKVANSTGNAGVSLGGFGGYIVLGFDQPIYNNPENPYGVDFTVFGNSFIANVKGVWTEPGAVQVMEDKNGNGIPDDGEWYELAGSDYWLSTTKHNVEMTYYNPDYNKRYTVPWTTNIGLSGALLTNQFHQQSYYPDYYYNNSWYKRADGKPAINREKMTYTGNIIQSTLDKRVPSYIEFYCPAAFGYCDNHGFSKTNPGEVRCPYARSDIKETGDGMDISWAVDKDGNHVELEKIDFVKIYTAGNVNAGWLGEWSTEVLGAIITIPEPGYKAEDFYMNYAGITQLQVVKGTTCQYEGLLFKNGIPEKNITQKWTVTADEAGKEPTTLATIDNTGKLTANDFGTVWVHFSAKDDIPEYNFEVEITELSGVIIDIEGNAGTVSNEKISAIVNENIFINVESLTKNENVVNGKKANRYIYDSYTWENSNPEVGTIENGTFKALKPGVTNLTVKSNTDSKLSAKIEVTVNPIPEVALVSEKIVIPYSKPKGELLNSDIFTSGNGATVYMTEISGDIAPFSLYNNHLMYEFNDGEFGTYKLHFKTECYKVAKEFDVIISYTADNMAMNKQLLVADTDADANPLTGVDIEDFSTNTRIASLGAVKADKILAEGAYVYASNGKNIYRYEVSTGKKVAELALNNDSHDFVIYEDKLIVSDGNTIKVVYKTDFAPYTDIVLTNPVEKLSLFAPSAYALSSNNGSYSLNVIDLSTFKVVKSDLALGDKKLKPAGVFAINAATVYIPSVSDGTNAASVLTVNVNDGAITTSESTIAPIANAKSVATMVGSMIYMSNGNGFITFNAADNTWGEKAVMEYDGAQPSAIVYNDKVFYNIYGTGVLCTYAETDLTKAVKVKTIATNSSATCFMDAVSNNMAPVAKKVVTNKMNEMTSFNWNINKSSGAFTDLENNYQMYARLPFGTTWATYTRTANLITLKVADDAFVVSQDTVIVVPIECIDQNGASALGSGQLTITCVIKTPEISENKIEIESNKTQQATVAVTDIFNYPSAPSTMKFNTVVESVGNSELVEAAIEDGNLVVKVKANTSGETNIVLAQTITANGNKQKTFKATIPVKVTDTTSGVDGVENANGIMAFYSNGTLYINGADGEEAQIFNVAGTLIKKYEVVGNEYATSIDLNEGVYVVTVANKSIKLIVK